MTLNERVKYLRKEIIKKTQQDFSDEIKISRSNLGNIETGEVSVTERVLYLICEKFNVNETWLRTGDGEIFNPLTRNQVITDFAGDLIKEDGTFRKRLIEALAKMDESGWIALEKLANELIKKD